MADDIGIAREASHILAVFGDGEKNAQAALELKARLQELQTKHPLVLCSENQQIFPPEHRQPLQSTLSFGSARDEERESPHYRRDPSTGRWVLIPSRLRRKPVEKHEKKDGIVQEVRKKHAKEVDNSRAFLSGALEELQRKAEEEWSEIIPIPEEKVSSLKDDLKNAKATMNVDQVVKVLDQYNDFVGKLPGESDKHREYKETCQGEIDSIKNQEQDIVAWCRLCRDRTHNPDPDRRKRENTLVFGLKLEDAKNVVPLNPEEWEKKDEDAWHVFLIKSKFPILVRTIESSGPPALTGTEPFQEMDGIGKCDVIVIGDQPFKDKETQNWHVHKTLGEMEDKFTILAMAAVMLRLKGAEFGESADEPGVFNWVKAQASQIQYSDKEKESGPMSTIKHVIVFGNHGKDAGARVAHPNLQIIQSPIVPSEIRRELDHAKDYYDEHAGRCCFCDMIAAETALEAKENASKTTPEASNHRIVYDADNDFVLLAPFAARAPFELWVLPKKHQSSMLEINVWREIESLGKVLYRALSLLAKYVHDPAYSLFVKNAPIPPQKDSDRYSHYHWRIVIELQNLAIP